MPSAVVFGCGGLQLSPVERSFFADADPWGFILFSRNVGDPDQVTALVDDLRSSVGRRAPVLIDQEGGRVARLRKPFWREWAPPAAEARAAASESVAEKVLRQRYQWIARELVQLGIDVNCVPSLDLPRNGDDGVIGDRAIGSSPGVVAMLGKAVCEAHLEAGVLPVLKHLPGHGSVGVDSHLMLPVSEVQVEELENWDFVPFRALADMPVAMTAHVAFSRLDPGVPATQSRTVIREVIRGSIGFDGLLLSDDLCMDALGGGPADRASASIAAGCDIVLYCSGKLDEMREAMKGISSLEGESKRRAAWVDSRRISILREAE